jgi:hypothetical protein
VSIPRDVHIPTQKQKKYKNQGNKTPPKGYVISITGCKGMEMNEQRIQKSSF